MKANLKKFHPCRGVDCYIKPNPLKKTKQQEIDFLLTILTDGIYYKCFLKKIKPVQYCGWFKQFSCTYNFFLKKRQV